MKKILLSILLMLLTYSVSLAQRSRKEKLDDWTFGVQFKPIIPVNYFGIGPTFLDGDSITVNISPKAGYSLGMVMRRNFTSLFSFETGINYVRRNYDVEAYEETRDTSDASDFGFVNYEIPLQALVYIRLSRQLYMNVSAGVGVNFYASDVQSSGANGLVETISRRERWAGLSGLANLGFELRTEEKGHFYIGASLVNPFGNINTTRASYYYDNLNNRSINFLTPLKGNYLTLDFRYFFHNAKDIENELP